MFAAYLRGAPQEERRHPHQPRTKPEDERVEECSLPYRAQGRLLLVTGRPGRIVPWPETVGLDDGRERPAVRVGLHLEMALPGLGGRLVGPVSEAGLHAVDIRSGPRGLTHGHGTRPGAMSDFRPPLVEEHRHRLLLVGAEVEGKPRVDHRPDEYKEPDDLGLPP